VGEGCAAIRAAGAWHRVIVLAACATSKTAYSRELLENFIKSRF
jgi:hypothetical protein